MRCSNAAQLISKSLDTKLNLMQTVKLRLHLMRCKGCKKLLQNYLFIQDACRALSGDSGKRD